MIRPLTCLCMLLAGGSGLTLYQEKHRTTLLDREVTQTIHATEAAHERTGLLKAEWALLNEPGHLQELADRLLALHPMTPSQFVQLADLAAHLPTAVPYVAASAAATVTPGPSPADTGLAPAPVDQAPLLAQQVASRPDARGEHPARLSQVAPLQHVAAFAVAAVPASVTSDRNSPGAAPPRVIRTARVESPREPRVEAAVTAPARPGAVLPATYGGFQTSYGAGRVMAPIMSAVATPMAQPAHTAPVLTRAATAMAGGGSTGASYAVPPYGTASLNSQTYHVQPSTAQPGQNQSYGSRFASSPAISAMAATAQTTYPGSSLGTGRASLAPPVPMGAGAQ